ncbi:MAG: hypothetical protein HY698_07595 [Deltaproteobacteria bacterium]|nr:hypothetical protein [Deltaproteobacteria bacterium]
MAQRGTLAATMKLGAMLVRDGRLTQAQVDAAVAHQARKGGRLGTALLELGLLDVDTLTVYLGLELGIPIATRGVLDRAKKAAVRLVSVDYAEKFLCIPLVVQDRQLICAMRDPHDLLALDELSAATGCRIIPRAAAEVRLYYYLERYYGVPRPQRYRTLGDWLAKERRMSGDDVEPPPPPLPGLPPPVEKPVMAPPMSSGPLRAISAAELEDEGLASTQESQDDAQLETAPEVPLIERSAPSRVEEARHAMAHGAAVDSLTSLESAPPPLDLSSAIQGMKAATARSDIADAIIGFGRGVFEIAALLVVREEVALGWRGFGPSVDLDRIETMLVPLSSPSMFREAIDMEDVFAGAAMPSALHAHLFKILRTSAPRQAVVLPVMIRERIVNLLYGQPIGGGTISDAQVEDLRKLARAAGDAYVRLIALQKQGN